MKYRKFGILDWEVSVLSLGVMKMPESKEDSIRIIRYGIENGINYLDTGYPYDMVYHEQLSNVIGGAIKDDFRERVRITATLPCPFVNSCRDFDRYLEAQLKWLDIDKIDFYLLGGLNRETWPRLHDLGVLEWAEKAVKDGLVDNLGFSMHDDYQTLRSILTGYDKWVLSQFQYSYMDVNHHPGIGGIRYAAEEGLAVVVSEPLKGGRLTGEQPEPVSEIWREADEKHSLVHWGLKWAWNLPEVSTVLCDMSNINQMSENLVLAERSDPESITIREEILMGRVREKYYDLRPIQCTACRCCMPCPLNIDVPRIFEIYNDAIIYDDVDFGRFLYKHEHHDAKDCSECGACEDACPKRIPILEWLKRATKLLKS
jgi:predicted aldo/keto reductase-like oxidoreductase